LDGHRDGEAGSAVAVLGGLVALRRWIKVGDRHARALYRDVARLGLAAPAARTLDPEHGWYFHSLGALSDVAARSCPHDASDLGDDRSTVPELFAVAIVTLISL